MPETKTPWQRLLDALVAAQVRRPLVLVALALASLVPAGLAARGLGLRTDFAELLPDNKPSVIEMRRVSAKLASASTLTLVAEVAAPNVQALQRFIDEVAPRLRALGPDLVGGVDEGTRERDAFFDENKLLYAPLDEIRKVHDEVRARWDWEVQKRTGGDLGLSDDEAPPPPITADSVKKRFEGKAKSVESKFGGYNIGEGGKIAAILVRTPVEPGVEAPAAEFRRRVERIVAEVGPTRFDPTLRVSYTGDFITSREAVAAIKDDLTEVGAAGVGMVLAVVLLFFLRFRALVAMGFTIAVGLIWTFGLTKLTVGHLNSSTGFLVSIIAGNGINFGIIYMARYLEARTVEGLDVDEAIRTAHRGTWVATLSAAAAAMVAYGSLAITDFRGFKHFGVIGGSGMVLCWIATYAFLPAVLSIAERARPLRKADGVRRKLHGLYGRGFAWLVARVPRALAVAGLVTGLVASVAATRYFAADPIEYDMRKLDTVRGDRTAAGSLSGRVDDIVGRLGQDGMAVMVDRLDQVKPLEHELDRRLAEAPADAKPFEDVVSIYDLVPGDQDEKLPLVEDTIAILKKARARGYVGDADWKELEPYLPKKPLARIGIVDLPEQMARAFTEADGTRGRIVYIVPKEGRSVWDAHYLMLWADSYRSVKLPNGEIVKGSGRAVIFADMIAAIIEDAPKAIAASLAGTILIVLLTFRGRRAGAIVLATLLLGVAWMVAFLAWREMKLNFLNFVALPITFGIGVDYAVNVMQRHELEGKLDLERVVVETGGAVALCSLTTILGYFSLTMSINRAVVSFGTAAAAGEIACIVGALLVLPAWLLLRERVSGPRAPTR